MEIFKKNFSCSRVLIVCAEPLKNLLSDFIRPHFPTFFASSLEEALGVLRVMYPAAIVSEIAYRDGELWSLAAGVRTGVLCDSATPVIALADEVTYALRVMAKEMNVTLLPGWGQPDRLISAIQIAIQAREDSKMSALIIDDDTLYANKLAKVLAKEFRPEICLAGSEGYDRWLNGRHDLVFLDLHLPDTHGSEIYEKIRSVDPYQPILIITAFLNPQNVLRSAARGAMHFIEKTEIHHEILKKSFVSILDAVLRRSDESEILVNSCMKLVGRASSALRSGKPYIAAKCLEWIRREMGEGAVGNDSLAELLEALEVELNPA